MKKPISIFKVSVLALTTASLTLSGCLFDKRSGGSGIHSIASGPGSSGSGAPSSDGALPIQSGGSGVGGTNQVLANLTFGMGTRDFNQINQSMAALTGIDPTSPGPVSAFNTSAALLPTNNDLTSVAGPVVVAVTSMAAQYCESLVTATAGLGVDPTFGSVSLTTAPSQAQINSVISSLLMRFNKDATADPADVLELQSLATDLTSGTLGAKATTKGLMISLCTAVLGSAKAVVVL
ncbi:MAG: hypothetical protein ACXVBW_05380 [Bdellovibrionota bacterium]